MDDEKAELAHLKKRLERERKARQEAEAIAERVTRELFLKQKELIERIGRRLRETPVPTRIELGDEVRHIIERIKTLRSILEERINTAEDIEKIMERL